MQTNKRRVPLPVLDSLLRGWLVLCLFSLSFAEPGWQAQAFTAGPAIVCSTGHSTLDQAFAARVLLIRNTPAVRLFHHVTFGIFRPASSTPSAFDASEANRDLVQLLSAGAWTAQKGGLTSWLIHTLQRGKGGYEEWRHHPGSHSIFFAGLFSTVMNFIVKASFANIKSEALLGVLAWVPASILYGAYYSGFRMTGRSEKMKDHEDVRPWRLADKLILGATILAGAGGQLLYFHVLRRMSPWSFSFLMIFYPYTNLLVSRWLFREHRVENGREDAAWARVMSVFYLCFAALGIRTLQGIAAGSGVGSWQDSMLAVGVGILSALFQIGQKILTNPPAQGGRGKFLPPRAFTAMSAGITSALLFANLVLTDSAALTSLMGQGALFKSALVILSFSTIRLFWSAHNAKAVRTEPLSRIAVAQLLPQQMHAAINFIGNVADQVLGLPALLVSGTIERWTFWDLPTWFLTFLAANTFFGQTFQRSSPEIVSTLPDVEGRFPRVAFDLRTYLNERVPVNAWPAWEVPVQEIERRLGQIMSIHGAFEESLCRRMIGELVQSLPLESPPGRQLLDVKGFVFDIHHGMAHSLVVISDAIRFARGEATAENFDLSWDDITVLVGIGLYHDLTVSVPRTRDRHHFTSAKLVRVMLPKIRTSSGERRYDDAMVESIADGCLRHRGRGVWLPLTLLQRAFVDADEIAADLERVSALPKDELFSTAYWEVYRAYTIRERLMFGAARSFTHSTDEHKELFRYLSFILIYRSNPDHYYTRLAKARVVDQYPERRRTFEKIMRDYMREDGLAGADVETTWRKMDYQLVQLEALFRKDPKARESVARLMQLSDIEDGPSVREQLLARVEALANDVTNRGFGAGIPSPSSEAIERFGHLLTIKEAQRSQLPEVVEGLKIMDDYLQAPNLPVKSLRKEGAAAFSDQKAGFAYALLKVVKDRIADLFEMTIPPGSAPIPAKGSNPSILKLGEALAIHFLHLIEGMKAETAATLIRGELNRLWSPTLDRETVEPIINLPMPHHGSLEIAA